MSGPDKPPGFGGSSAADQEEVHVTAAEPTAPMAAHGALAASSTRATGNVATQILARIGATYRKATGLDRFPRARIGRQVASIPRKGAGCSRLNLIVSDFVAVLSPD